MCIVYPSAPSLCVLCLVVAPVVINNAAQTELLNIICIPFNAPEGRKFGADRWTDGLGKEEGRVDG